MIMEPTIKEITPDLEPLIRFEVPTTGQVFDARGKILITLAY